MKLPHQDAAGLRTREVLQAAVMVREAVAALAVSRQALHLMR
jgi:hypothetical protein